MLSYPSIKTRLQLPRTGNYRTRLVKTGILLLISVAVLSGCASAPKPEVIGMQITAAGDVNPDLQGRPSPVILHVLELNSEEQFNRLDYMSLTQPDGAALGQDLLGKTRLVLTPGTEFPNHFYWSGRRLQRYRQRSMAHQRAGHSGQNQRPDRHIGQTIHFHVSQIG